MSKLNTKIYKFFRTKAASIDEANKTIQFKISDNKVDRYGEIVDQKSWQLGNYELNPIVLWKHDPDEPENVLGTVLSIEPSEDGSETYATVQLDDDINPKASLIWKQLVKGTLRCVSIGFIPHSEELEDDVPVLKDNELMEISIVPIPANPRAVALAYKSGDINAKDAKWLVDGMRREADLIERQMEQELQETPSDTDGTKEKTVNDKQITALLEGMSKQAEKIDTLTTALSTTQDELNTRLASVEASLKAAPEVREKGAVTDILDSDRSWEAEDEKWDKMDTVSEIYYAFCEAYFYSATPVGDFTTLLNEFIQILTSVADGSDVDAEGEVSKALNGLDKAHVKAVMDPFFRKAKEATTDASEPHETETTEPPEDPTDKEDGVEADKTEDEPDTSAKGGDNDQSGAEYGEISDDTELTPELQAQIDQQIEAGVAKV